MSTKSQRSMDRAIDRAKELPKAIAAVREATGVDEHRADRAVWAAWARKPSLRGMNLIIQAIDEAVVRMSEVERERRKGFPRSR